MPGIVAQIQLSISSIAGVTRCVSCLSLLLYASSALQLPAQARSQEAFEATCGLHGAMSGGSQLEAAEGARSCASAVMGGDDGEDSAWGWQTPPLNSPSAEARLGGIVLQGDTSSEIDAGAAGGARSFRRGMRMLPSGRFHYDTSRTTVAFIFETGPVVLWIAASDTRATDSRGRRELLSSLLFFLSHFASQSQTVLFHSRFPLSRGTSLAR